MSKITTKRMVGMFGAQNMSDCTEVTERLSLKEDGWEMTRVYRYADGTEKSIIGANESYYCLVPAAAGWVAETDSYYDGETARERHPIAVWRFVLDGQDTHLFPEFPGDRSMTHAVAVISPDGRVFEVGNDDSLVNNPFPSVMAWRAHVERKRAEDLAQKEKERVEEEKARQERDAGIVFRDGQTLADVRKFLAEEGFDVVPNRADRMSADEIPF
jgi:hypothetical protein